MAVSGGSVAGSGVGTMTTIPTIDDLRKLLEGDDISIPKRVGAIDPVHARGLDPNNKVHHAAIAQAHASLTPDIVARIHLTNRVRHVIKRDQWKHLERIVNRLLELNGGAVDELTDEQVEKQASAIADMGDY